MTFQAYLDTIKEKTGLGPEDFKKLAKEKGLTKHAEIVDWLKKDYDLGVGHARALVLIIQSADAPKITKDEAIDKHFTGKKAAWRESYDTLMTKLNKFGDDVSVGAGKTYMNLLRDGKKFGIVQVSGERMDVGIKRKGAPAEGRFEESGSWNSMVTHRVRITDVKQIDAELVKWLREAYDKA